MILVYPHRDRGTRFFGGRDGIRVKLFLSFCYIGFGGGGGGVADVAAIPVYRRVCDLSGLLQRESIYLFGRLPRPDMIGPRHLATNGYSCIQLPAHVLIPEACRDYHLYPVQGEDLLKPSGLSYNSLGCLEYLAGKYNYKMDQGLAFNSPPGLVPNLYTLTLATWTERT